MERERDTLSEDLTVVGLILIILVMCSVLFIKIYKIEKELIQAKELVVELDEEVNNAYVMVQSLNDELDRVDKINNLDNLLKELSQVKSNHKLTLVVCFTESSLNKKAVHTGWYNKNITGHLCGIKNHWIDIIPELNHDNINTLYGGSLVINYLLEKHNNNLFLAIKEFKGAEKNLTTTYKTIKLYRKIQHKQY